VRDATTRVELWSARETLSAADLSGPITPNVFEIANGARSAVRTAETRRAAAAPRSALVADELLQLAWEAYAKDHSLAGVREALALVDAALQRDPASSAAWTSKAILVNLEGDVDPQQDRERIGREQDEFTKRAVTLDPNDASAWNSRATALVYLSRWDAALEAAARAMRLEPDYPDHRLVDAWIRGLMGRPEDALAIVADVLATRPDQVAGAMRTACEANVLAGQAAAAVPACEKSSLLYADMASTVYLLAAYAGNGNGTKAAATKAELMRVAPGYTIEHLRAKRYSDHPDYVALAERNLYPALRKAGIAER
jgi:tetratricopeptide (TPR) repeat protein